MLRRAVHTVKKVAKLAPLSASPRFVPRIVGRRRRRVRIGVPRPRMLGETGAILLLLFHGTVVGGNLVTREPAASLPHPKGRPSPSRGKKPPLLPYTKGLLPYYALCLPQKGRGRKKAKVDGRARGERKGRGEIGLMRPPHLLLLRRGIFSSSPVFPLTHPASLPPSLSPSLLSIGGICVSGRRWGEAVKGEGGGKREKNPKRVGNRPFLDI